MRGPTAYRLTLLGILAGAAGLYLLGNERVPLWDRDEPRYAECSREMLQSGDWVVPRFLGQLRTHKPPFIYWCQATAMSVLGDTAAAARLPSAIAVFLTAAMLVALVRRNSDWPRAIWSACVFCTCALTIGAAKVCITDAVLLLWVCIGQGCLYAAWKNRGASATLQSLFWLSVGIAGLTKGPVVLAMHAATLVALAAFDITGNWKSCSAWKSAIAWWPRLRPVMGLLIVIAVVCPWLVLVNRRAPDFLPRLINRAGRYATGGAEGHAQPPGFYLLTIWITMFPWSLILPTAIITGFRRKKQPMIRFALAAAIGPWLAMELVTNKLPFYILPSFPALAVLTAEVIVGAADDLKRRPFLVGVGGWGLAVLGLGIVPLVLFSSLAGSQWAEIIWLIAAVIYLFTVAVAFVRRQVRFAAGAMAGGMALLAVILFAGLLPSLPPLSASRSVGQELIALGAGGATPVAMIDYREPSLAFYQGGGARESDPTALASPTPPDWAVITMNAWSRLAPAVQSAYQIVSQPRAVLRYNDGWRMDKLVIIRKDR
jgi:4-amino-4-deoxy-L-arabinose transferase-like glycosyltransferase